MPSIDPAAAANTAPPTTSAPPRRLLQIRAYALKPGCGDVFERLFVERSLPMLAASSIDVVAFGPSPHEPDAWYLIRAFDDLAHLNAQEDAFYGADAWRLGPREAILAAIDRHLDTLLWMSAAGVDDLRRSNAVSPMRGSQSSVAGRLA